ncbi:MULTISPECIES: hypothetical protein [Hungatella]|nr:MULTISPECIES: hypothetical protein [Hungatella]MCQ4831099.1 hypothetical protein [Hungatella sp. SL.1.14]
MDLWAGASTNAGLISAAGRAYMKAPIFDYPSAKTARLSTAA